MSNWIVVPLIVFTYLTAGSAPAGARDSDQDGLPDRWERKYHISTSKKSGEKDPDHDALRNRREYNERTNPRKRDTDRDGWDDRAELRAGANPKNASDRPFPNRSTTGVPANWKPAHTQSTTMTVRTPGAVVKDVLLQDGADLIVAAPNVTIRRVKLEGGAINNVAGSDCNNGLLVERTTIEPRAGEDSSDDTEGALGYGGYTARRVQIWHRSEGFRVGGNEDGCGPVRIVKSFAAVTPPQPCGDWHGDGLQGFGGPALTLRDTTLDLDITGCGGTAPFFYPSGQDNTSVDIDGLLVKGGGAPFRLGTPGTVSNLRVANRSWVYFPVDVNCSALRHWDARIVAITPDYQVARNVRELRCSGVGN